VLHVTASYVCANALLLATKKTRQEKTVKETHTTYEERSSSTSDFLNTHENWYDPGTITATQNKNKNRFCILTHVMQHDFNDNHKALLKLYNSYTSTL